MSSETHVKPECAGGAEPRPRDQGLPTSMHLEAPVPVAMLLRQNACTESARAEVTARATRLGFTPTATGRVSMSFRIEPETLQRTFGVGAVPALPTAPSSTDFGSPAGYAATELTVPLPLQPYVALITVSSAAIRLQSPEASHFAPSLEGVD